MIDLLIMVVVSGLKAFAVLTPCFMLGYCIYLTVFDN